MRRLDFRVRATQAIKSLDERSEIGVFSEVRPPLATIFFSPLSLFALRTARVPEK